MNQTISSPHTALSNRLKSKDAKICVVGLGYVGLPLVLRYTDVGFSVLGIDIDEAKVEQLNNGESYIEHISKDRVKNANSHGFKATTDFSMVNECDAIILCVPTPLNKFKEPDMRYVKSTADSISPWLRSAQAVSLESTTYPGTTEEELLPRLESGGLIVGKDIFLIYSPEREDPGNPNFETQTIPKILGGHTEACKSIGIQLYEKAIDTVVPVSSTKVAEMTKLLENIHRAVNIGLVNEMKIVADQMGIDIFEVIDAAATKPFGFTVFQPGPGLGGHCIPIDPFYLTWKAKEYGVHTRFIELAGEINQSMPGYVVSKLTDALNEKKIPLNGSKILILGIAYKKNVDDMRESPSVTIMEKLREKGADVHYSDPHVPKFPKLRDHQFDLKSVELSQQSLAKFDAVVLATDHDLFDYELIKNATALIVDSRGKYRGYHKNIINA